MANLPTTDLAARVMQLLPAEHQPNIATRIALMAKTNPEVVREVARVMREKLETVTHQEYAAAGGVQVLAAILNAVDRTTERNILERLAGMDPELAEQVRALLFVFEDVLKLDDRAIQLVLKEVESKDLALALRGASAEVVERLTSNMSSRAAEMLAEEIEIMPPQRRKVVEEAQSKVVASVRRLEEAGEIFVSRGSSAIEDEEQVV
jgi:flagellar motor switch protein FliG